MNIFEKKEILWKKNNVIFLKKENWEFFLDKNWNKVSLSKYDIKDFIWLNNDEVIKYISDDLWIDITTKEWLDHLNYLFEFIIINILENSNYNKILIRKWINIKEILPNKNKFDNIWEIIEFIKTIEEDRNNKETSLSWNTKCLIIKIVSTVNNLIENNLHDLTWIENKFFNLLNFVLNLKSIWEDNYEFEIHWRKVIFYGRPKNIISCVFKSITNSNYNDLSKLKDSIWYTFEVLTEKDIEYLLKTIINSLTSLWAKKLKIKNKGFKINLDYIDIKIENSKKWATWENYKDIKVSCEIDWVPWWVEVKIVKRWNINHVGLQSHFIYKLINVNIEWILKKHLFDWYIKKEDIRKEVDFFIDHLTEEKIQWNKETRDLTITDYLLYLWKDLNDRWFIMSKKISNHRSYFIQEIKEWLTEYIDLKINEQK